MHQAKLEQSKRYLKNIRSYFYIIFFDCNTCKLTQGKTRFEFQDR